jgi:hypothetical protein
MVAKFSAKKKLWVSKVDDIGIGFLLGNLVYVHFARVKRLCMRNVAIEL